MCIVYVYMYIVRVYMHIIGSVESWWICSLAYVYCVCLHVYCVLYIHTVGSVESWACSRKLMHVYRVCLHAYCVFLSRICGVWICGVWSQVGSYWTYASFLKHKITLRRTYASLILRACHRAQTYALSVMHASSTSLGYLPTLFTTFWSGRTDPVISSRSSKLPL